MIHILAGNDTKKRSDTVKTLGKGSDVFFLRQNDFSKEILNNYANNINLFGLSPVIVLENVLQENKVEFSAEELTFLKNSKTIFIFLEDKLLAKEEKKYKKYVNVEYFDQKMVKQAPRINTFAVADAFSKRDKIGAWVCYRGLVEGGIEPEAISGIIFWKIKIMILNGSKVFSLSELKKQSGKIVSLYHKAHAGECDFVVGLEQFILLSLSKSN